MNVNEQLAAHSALSKVLHRLSDSAPREGRLYLVGGAVRDLVRGDGCPADIDLVLTDGSPTGYGKRLFERLTPLTFHSDQAYKTVSLEILSGGRRFRLDINHTRRESYPAPGSLPRFDWIDSLYFDMARRDFSVNALAISLDRDSYGELIDYCGGCRDIFRKSLRVLHDRSFLDDPTRILRLFRYRARLGFSVDPHTMDLLVKALDADCLATLTPDRLMREFFLCLSESNACEVLEGLADFGILSPGFMDLASLCSYERDGEAHWKRELPELDSVLVKILLLRDDSFLSYNMNRLYRNTLSHWIRHGEEWRERVRQAASPSVLYDLLSPHPPEALVALAQTGGTGSAEWQASALYFSSLQGTSPHLTGKDLLDLGVPAGPAVGRILSELLHLRLDRRIEDSRKAEVDFVLKHLERDD